MIKEVSDRCDLRLVRHQTTAKTTCPTLSYHGGESFWSFVVTILWGTKATQLTSERLQLVNFSDWSAPDSPKTKRSWSKITLRISGSTWFDGPTVTCGADGPFRRTNIWCYLSPNFWCKKVRKKHLKPVIRHCFFKAKLRVITKYLILIHCGMAWIVHLACLPRAALLLEIPSAHFCSSADPSWRRDTPAAPVHLVLGSVSDKSNLM